jgi:transcriptional regulator with GAF, ATPase, and Fis domain
VVVSYIVADLLIRHRLPAKDVQCVPLFKNAYGGALSLFMAWKHMGTSKPDRTSGDSDVGENLAGAASDLQPYAPTASPPLEALEDVEREHILQILRKTGWVIGGRRGAAVRLALRRTALMSKMRKLGISHEEYIPVDREVS